MDELKKEMRKWTDEGILYRRDKVIVLKPKKGNKNWRVRLVKSQRGVPLGIMEKDFHEQYYAFAHANNFVKYLRKERRKAFWKKIWN